MSSADFEMTTQHSGGRSAWGTASVVAVVLSAIGLVITNVAVLMNAHGFQSKSNVQTPLSNTVFFTFVLGAVAAVITGVIAYVRSRSSAQQSGDRRAALTVAAYIVVAVVSIFVVNIVNPNN
jgi:ABC-type Fe3+ transport system permease subunit